MLDGVAVGSKGAHTVATWLLKIAQDALNGSMGASLALMGLLLVAILAIVGVVALVVTGIKALVNWYNRDAIASEKAAQRANELAEAYNSVKEAYDNLKNSIADYENA